MTPPNRGGFYFPYIYSYMKNLIRHILKEETNSMLEKNKKFLTNLMGIDFTGNIEQVTSTYDVPMEFDNNISSAAIKYYLIKFGPMYLFELDGMQYLYQDHNYVDFFIDENGFYYNDEIPEQLGIDVMGLRFSDIIDLYFNEDESINESLIKEDTNKSLNIITKYYDIEDNGSVYRGENRFQTYVTFYPKDYDNEMTREAATSTCNWEIDDDGELIFKLMSLPQPYLIPLMNYVGYTEDLEDYLEDIHVQEAEKFLKRIKHRRDNPLK
jgi:hypothetical protein